MEDKILSDCSKLLLPEILTAEELVGLLKQHNVDASGSCDKATLVQLAYRFLVPRPQRKYRANRRGVAMTSSQLKRDRQLNRNTISFSSNNTSTYTIRNPNPSRAQNKIRSMNTTAVASQPSAKSDRLKPPPSAINMDRKVIKLNSTAQNGVSSVPSADRISVGHSKTPTSNTNGTTTKSSGSNIGLNSMSAPAAKLTEVVVSSRKIQLSKNSCDPVPKATSDASSGLQDNKRPAVKDVTHDGNEPKKFKPSVAIKWP